MLTAIAGSTYRWTLTATKDGTAWDLSAATVTLTLRGPDGTATDYDAVTEGDGTNVRSYDTAVGDLPASRRGLWARSWKVEVGDVVQESRPIAFQVIDSP